MTARLSDRRFRKMQGVVSSFTQNERGSTAIDYALIASFISGAIVGVIYTLGDNVFALYESVGAVWPI